ncbi:DNA glycosylase AlkZ-like family protein [Paenibacillus sp. sptzw28]|uniref:DNA glycosylase AlkZ-like family protein n=1 Tax=Paenibacillus sp. sptzw28 TaxID=715179 RepID=UPI0037C6BFB6
MEPSTEAEGEARLVELWLRAFGPVTATDIKWWLGRRSPRCAGRSSRSSAFIYASKSSCLSD